MPLARFLFLPHQKERPRCGGLSCGQVLPQSLVFVVVRVSLGRRHLRPQGLMSSSGVLNVSIHCLNLAFGVHLPNRPAEKLVLLALADRASDEDGSAYPSVWNLVYKTSLDERTVRRALASLEARGFLRREPRANKSSVYWLNASALLAASVAWPNFPRRSPPKGKAKASKGSRS